MVPLQVRTFAAAFAFGLAACSGGGGSGSPPVPGGGGTPTDMTKPSIAAVDAVGGHAKTITTQNVSLLAPSLEQRLSRFGPKIAATCTDGIEFFAPDRNGDANSAEVLYFYNAHCTQLAVDVVHIFTSTGANSETSNDTLKSYAPGHPGTPTTTVTAASNLSNATFDAYGFPIVADGFDATTIASLALGATPTIDADDEVVMEPSTTNVSDFCNDFAGYDIPGIASLNKTFGTEGGALSGATRTVNTDGSVTWDATTTGKVIAGPIGSLAIVQHKANTACPISKPQFKLSGGNSLGDFSIPLTLTFDNGVLTDASVGGATLPDGLTLDVTTNTHSHPGNPNYIRGTISNSGAAVAKFGLDAFGNGHLIILGTGHEFKVVDWTVVQR